MFPVSERVRRYPRLWEALFIPLTLFGIWEAFLGKFAGGDYSVATFQDATHFTLPLFAHISKSFAAGEFPYWINTVEGGLPLYNTPQFSFLYPLYFFGWNLYGTPLETSLHVHDVELLHVAILWMTTYVMMRIFHLRIIPSILGATLFAFCANTYVYLFWVNIISPYSWLPLGIGSVFLILENEYPKTGLGLGWISILLLTTASPAQPLIHFVFCALFLVVSYGIIHRKDTSKLRGPLRNLILLACGSIVLSSATLVPTLLFAQRDMIRWTDFGAVIGNQRVPFQAFLTGQTKVTELAKVLFPLNLPQNTGDSYLGVLPVLLAFFALFRSRRNWIVIPLLILALYALLSSTGVHLGFAYINYAIPLWNKIRENGRHLYIFALAACTLAAFGFEHLAARQEISKRDLPKHAVVFGSFLILLFACYWVRQKYETFIPDSTLLWSLVVFLALLFLSWLTQRSNPVAQVLLAAIVIYPSLRYPVPIVRVQEGDYFDPENLRSHRILQEVSKIKDIANYRLLVADDRFSPGFWSMNAAYYGVRTFDAFLNPLPHGQWLEMAMASYLPRYAQLLGAKYYLSCTDSLSPPEGYLFEREIENCSLYSSNDAKPHYFLSTEIGLPYGKVERFIEALQQNSVDPDKLSISSKDMGPIAEWLGKSREPLRSETFMEKRSINNFEFGLRTNRRSVLVLNEYFRDEWQVAINGLKVKPFKVNLSQIGIFLPAGSNEVHFEYRPRLFIALLYLQRIAFCILAGVLAAALAKHLYVSAQK